MLTLLRWVAERVLSDQGQYVSLRTKLFIGALLLGTLPLLVASVVLPTRLQSTLTAAGHDHLMQVARDLATLTQNEMQHHLGVLRGLAGMDALAGPLRQRNADTLKPAQLAEVNRQLGTLMRGFEDEFQGIFLCGTDGVVFAGVLQNGDTRPYQNLSIQDRAYFTQARSTLQPVISDPLKSKVDEVPIVVIAVPLLDGHGGFAGLLGLSLEIGHLTEIISHQRLGRSGYPFAIDRQGIIVAHPDSQRLFADLRRIPGATALAARMLRGESGVATYVSSKGAEKIAAFAPVPVVGWSVAASMETADFAAPAARIRWIILGLLGACLLLAGLAAAAFAVGLEDLKQALAEARASETRFKLFASVSPETIWDWNLETDAVWWNKALTAEGGYAPGEARHPAEAFDRWLPDHERERISRGIRSCINGKPWADEHYFRRQDGTLAYVLHRATAVQDPAGRAVRVIGSMTDISARRASEEKLKEQAALLDQAPDGILVHDLQQVIRFWNRGAERLYGWRAEDAIGHAQDELFQGDPGAFAQAWQTVQAKGEWFGTLQKFTRAGILLTLDCRWTLLRDEHGQPKSILTIDTDITERRQMEAKFLRAQRLESIGTLAGGIAHDLNNLLAPIVIGVGMLRHLGTSKSDREIIQCIEQSAKRGTNLVKQVLSFAQGVEGAKVAVHVGYVAREVEAIIRSTFPKDITVRIDIPKEIALILADPTQINQILMNLCVNARDAMPGGGRLSVSAKSVVLDEAFTAINQAIVPGPYVLIEVADTGTGMAKDTVDKLFVPFFTTKPAGKGTGLGLSTVIGITRNHRGTVNVYSEPGKGSVFKVFLPAIADSAGTLAPDARSTPPMGRAGGTILLVDDEPTILTVTQQALESCGYKVLTACDGAQAFALYLQHRGTIAVVITDMMMPMMDGYALIAAVRRLDPHIALVAASGLNDNNNQIKAAEAGIRHFLCKPYTTASLLGAIDAALAARVAAPAGTA